MAEELLHRLQVPGHVETSLARGVPRLVHPCSSRDAFCKPGYRALAAAITAL